MCFLGFAYGDSPAVTALIHPVYQVMGRPVEWVFDTFAFDDDDPRVLLPVLLSTLLWALAGGALALLLQRVASAVRRP